MRKILVIAWDFCHRGGERFPSLPTWWISHYYLPPLLMQTSYKWYKVQYKHNSANLRLCLFNRVSACRVIKPVTITSSKYVRPLKNCNFKPIYNANFLQLLLVEQTLTYSMWCSHTTFFTHNDLVNLNTTLIQFSRPKWERSPVVHTLRKVL